MSKIENIAHFGKFNTRECNFRNIGAIDGWSRSCKH